MPQSFSCLHAHIVFSTKNRQPFLAPNVTERLYPYLGGILRNRKCQLLRVGGIEDHIHLLVRQARDISIAGLVGEMKSISSGWIHDEFPNLKDFYWQQGYAAFSVSLSGIDAVMAYIENQAEHHRERSFQDELREILAKHGIEFDERYMWD